MQVTRLSNAPDSVTATLVFNSEASNYWYRLPIAPQADIKSQAKELAYHRELKSGRMLNREYLFDAPVLVSDTVPEITWTISYDAPVRIISNLSCRKAEGNFRGRQYIAWFSEQYPTKAGPWKLAGLPGLIIEAEDSDGAVKYSLLSIVNTGDKVTVPDAPIEVSQALYVQGIRNKLNALNYSISSEDVDISIQTTSSIKLNVLERSLFEN
jgi:GLPGLI family protein